jgi:hypothetical protein
MYVFCGCDPFIKNILIDINEFPSKVFKIRVKNL